MSTHLTTLLCMLLTASMMWPSEGAINGSGLHIVVLWLTVGLIGVWSRISSGQRSRISIGAAIAWSLLVVGFWLSGYSVFQVQGDRRAAINLCFEWTAIGVAWWLVSRAAIGQRARQSIVTVVVGLCFGAAVYGIVQHHVTDAAHAEWYKRGRAILDTAALAVDMREANAARQVAAEFRAMDIPLAGAGRELFERRMLSSSEPTGPFALANTLSGLLAVSLVLLVGVGLQHAQKSARLASMYFVRSLPFLLTIAYCLILTKSRTAWVALGFGIFVLLIGRGLKSRFVFRFTLGAVVVTTAVVGLGIGTGALDREVVFESSRSLQVRLLYWMGAVGVIQEKPIFGAGPGNFRQTYLAHKPVESSEEILDPHNILLDAWCSAGIVGCAGMCLLSWVFACGAIGRPPTDVVLPREFGDSLLAIGWPKAAVLGIFAGTAVHLLWRWVGGGQFWDTESSSFAASQNFLLLVPAGAAVVSLVLFRSLSPSVNVISAAGVTLFVHLLGAGGLQITVAGLALAVLSGCVSAMSVKKHSHSERDRRFPLSRIAAISLLSGGIWAVVDWGVLPVQRADQYLRLAETLENRGNLAAAMTQLRRGAESDTLSVNLRQRRAEMLTYQLKGLTLAHAPQAQEKTAQMLDDALTAVDDFISADQRNWMGYVLKANINEISASLVPASRQLALAEIEKATELYPTNAELWVALAELASVIGDEQRLRNAVNNALAIEKSNRNWGHVDRYLAEDTLLWLNEHS